MTRILTIVVLHLVRPRAVTGLTKVPALESPLPFGSRERGCSTSRFTLRKKIQVPFNSKAPDLTQRNISEEGAARPANLFLTKGITPTMATKMQILDPSTLSDVAATVTYNPQSEVVTLPTVTSLMGITVVTGGTEFSCVSCMLAFCFWTTLISLSCIAVGVWDQLNNSRIETSYLLVLGIVILSVSLVIVGSVLMHSCLIKRRSVLTQQRHDGKEVLLENKGVIKKVTV